MLSRASRLQNSEGQPGKQYARHVLDRFNTYDGCKARTNSACQPGMLFRKRVLRLCASEEERVAAVSSKEERAAAVSEKICCLLYI